MSASASREDLDVVRAALADVASKRPSGTLLHVRDVRTRAALPKARFDAAARALSASLEAVLHHHDHPMSLSPAEREELIYSPNGRDDLSHKGTYYIGIAPREPELNVPVSRSKTTSPLAVSKALQSWTAASNTIQVRIARALERAKATNGQAGVALGRNRLEVRRDSAGAWSIVWPRTGEPAFFVAKTPKRSATKGEKSAGGRWTKKAIVRDFERRDLAQVNDGIKATRKARSADLAEQRGQCRTWAQEAASKNRGDDRRVARAEARQRCATALAEKEKLHATKLRELRARKPAPRPRAAAPQRARERLAERDDAVASELVRRGRADLVKLWNRTKGEARYKGASADRAIERFVEAVEEDAQRVEQLQEERGAVSGDVYACEQAHELAKSGDAIAKQYAAENCDGARPRKKQSPAERTLTMLNLPNPEPARIKAEKAAKAKKRAEAKKKPPAKVPPKGQQALGTTFTPLVDAGGPQLSLDSPRPRRRASAQPSDVPF